jgi:K+-transporting ATPase ATPase C chain
MFSNLFSHLRSALVSFVVLTGVTGIVYPALMTATAQVAFPGASGGSVVRASDGRVLGSALLGVCVEGDGFFHGRPSALGAPGCHAELSGGSNLGPTNPDLAARLRHANAEQTGARPPADLLTTSASGLDPHISPASARFQVPRVAKARGLPEAQLYAWIDAHTEAPTFGILGEPRVNVLALNAALLENQAPPR